MFGAITRKLGKSAGFLAAVTGVALAGGAAGAFVMAAIPDSNGVIHACYATKDGTGLRLIDSEAGQACTSKETGITWNQTGPQGPQGPAGSGTVLANEVAVAQGSLNLGDTPIPILVVPDFGVFEAIQCDTGNEVWQFHNTTSHVVYNGTQDFPVAPGGTQQYPLFANAD